MADTQKDQSDQEFGMLLRDLLKSRPPFQGNFPTPEQFFPAKKAAQDFLRLARLHLPIIDINDLKTTERLDFLRVLGLYEVLCAALKLDCALHPTSLPDGDIRTCESEKCIRFLPVQLSVAFRYLVSIFYQILIFWEWRGSWDYITPEEAQQDILAPLPMLDRGITPRILTEFERVLSLLSPSDPSCVPGCSSGIDKYYHEPTVSSENQPLPPDDPTGRPDPSGLVLPAPSKEAHVLSEYRKHPGWETWSFRRIAEATGTSKTTVARVLKPIRDKLSGMNRADYEDTDGFKAADGTMDRWE